MTAPIMAIWHRGMGEFLVIRILTIAACPSLSRKCRSYAGCQHKIIQLEQWDRKWTRSRFAKFPALSDKNLMKAAGQGPGHSMANRLPVQLRRRHHLHRGIAKKTFFCGHQGLGSEPAFVDRNSGFPRQAQNDAPGDAVQNAT